MGRRLNNDWEANEAGDELAGTLTDAMIVPATRWGDVVVAIITEDGTGIKYGLWLSRKVLVSKFNEVRPAPGSLIVVLYKGTKVSKAGYEYHDYVMIASDTMPPTGELWIDDFLRTSVENRVEARVAATAEQPEHPELFT